MSEFFLYYAIKNLSGTRKSITTLDIMYSLIKFA